MTRTSTSRGASSQPELGRVSGSDSAPRPDTRLHLMIDIETLATHTHAPILQFAAAKFDSRSVDIDVFTTKVCPQFTPTHIPDPSTIAWWFEQIRHSPKLYPLDLQAPSFPHAFDSFLGWLGASTIDGVWANDPSFDLAILTSHARHHDLHIPWSHRNERSYRTLVATIPPDIYKAIKQACPNLLAHDASSDAITQAQRVITMNNFLVTRGVNVL